MVRTKYTEDDFRCAGQEIYPGPDLEWFAIDSGGRVAGFTNAGFATVPASVFKSWEMYNRTLDAIDILPSNGDADWVGLKPPMFHTWADWSSRGLFGFDWNHGSSVPNSLLPYVLMTAPSQPLHLSQLPDDVAAYISLTAFPELDFRDCRKLLVAH